MPLLDLVRLQDSRQPWFRDAADDSRDERLTYSTYQRVRSILASLVVRKSNRKGPYRGDARQVSEPDSNDRKGRLLIYIEGMQINRGHARPSLEIKQKHLHWLLPHMDSKAYVKTSG